MLNPQMANLSSNQQVFYRRWSSEPEDQRWTPTRTRPIRSSATAFANGQDARRSATTSRLSLSTNPQNLNCYLFSGVATWKSDVVYHEYLHEVANARACLRGNAIDWLRNVRLKNFSVLLCRVDYICVWLCFSVYVYLSSMVSSIHCDFRFHLCTDLELWLNRFWKNQYFNLG